jgi:hypothetical protein
VTLPLWPDLDPPPRPRRRKWQPRCEDCKRKIWAADSLKRRFGLLLGGGCYRKRRRAEKRVVIRITYSPPGDIPGQTDLLEST